MADGHLNKCKECTKRDSSSHRDTNIEKVKEYDKKRADLPHRVKARKKYAKTEEGRIKTSEAKERYKERNPKKRQAHIIFNNHLRDGKVTKLSICQSCNTEHAVEAHHCDYNKPLEVIWMCYKCHKKWHKENNPIV